jgi:hypothetical protein
MVTMPPITTVREWVPEWSPTINPNVVITPDVRPKLRPVLNDDFIINLHRRCESAHLQAAEKLSLCSKSTVILRVVMA